MKVRLTNLATNQKYLAMVLDSWAEDSNVQVSTIPLPEEDASQTILLNFGGQQTTIMLSWPLAASPNNSDLSLGTSSSPIISTTDQYMWLSANFISADSSVSILVELLDDNGNVLKSVTGVTSRLRLELKGGTPIGTANLQLVQGTNFG